MHEYDATGVVDFFNDTGGYGFIKTDATDEDVFFHMEDIGGPDLEEGTDVYFNFEQAPKEPRTTEIARASQVSGNPVESGSGDTEIYTPSESGADSSTGTEVYAGSGSEGPNFCPNCGAELPEYEPLNHCPVCGSDV